MSVQETEWLSVKQVAHIIGKSHDYLDRQRKHRGDGPKWYRIGGRIKYSKADVLKWLEGCLCQ
jgi:predicted DNA-binding transcriptional regulator AlpA